MVRRGSPVRVLKRALEKSRISELSFRIDLQMIERAPGMEPFVEPLGRKGRPAAALQRPGRGEGRARAAASAPAWTRSSSAGEQHGGETVARARIAGLGARATTSSAHALASPRQPKSSTTRARRTRRRRAVLPTVRRAATFAWTDAVDDGGWRAFVPVTDDFMIAPDGSFVDE
jgi:hypothetical protein